MSEPQSGFRSCPSEPQGLPNRQQGNTAMNLNTEVLRGFGHLEIRCPRATLVSIVR